MSSSREIALNNTILRGIIGSSAYGVTDNGKEDRDEMGVFVEPIRNVLGLTYCDNYIYRDKPDGIRSESGDLDLSMYSLRRFCHLATQGNPSILFLLWLPQSGYIQQSDVGKWLVEMREDFISRESGKRFLGYLTSQKLRFNGERTRTVNRPDLVSKYGYDTKFAMHALRLGLEGIELMQNRRIVIPHVGENLALLRSVRDGEISFAEVLKLIEKTEEKLRKLVDACDWIVDRNAIDDFLMAAHFSHWDIIADPFRQERGK